MFSDLPLPFLPDCCIGELSGTGEVCHKGWVQGDSAACHWPSYAEEPRDNTKRYGTKIVYQLAMVTSVVWFDSQKVINTVTCLDAFVCRECSFITSNICICLRKKKHDTALVLLWCIYGLANLVCLFTMGIYDPQKIMNTM